MYYTEATAADPASREIDNMARACLDAVEHALTAAEQAERDVSARAFALAPLIDRHELAVICGAAITFAARVEPSNVQAAAARLRGDGGEAPHFAGWWRDSKARRGRWRKVTEGTESAVWDVLLDLPAGDKLVTTADVNPNERSNYA